MPRGLLARAIISKRVQATNADVLATFSLLPQIYPSTRIIQHPPFFSSSSLPSNFRNFHPFSFSSPSHGGFPLLIDRYENYVRRRCNFKFSPREFDGDTVINPARVGKTVNPWKED